MQNMATQMAKLKAVKTSGSGNRKRQHPEGFSSASDPVADYDTRLATKGDGQ